MKKILFFLIMIIASKTVLYSQDSIFNKIQVKGNQIMRPTFEDITIYRIQLRLTTGRGNDAGTDGGVYIQLSDLDEKFYMSRGIDNYEEGHSDTYDVLSSVVKQIKDIKFLKFGVKGDDGWCMKKIELFLNDNDFPVFSKSFSGRGQCMDNNGSFTIPGTELRNHSNWAYTSNHRDIWKAPVMISKDMIKSLVECSIGNQITQSNSFGWGTTSGIDTRWGDVVEMKQINDHTIQFDLDLQRYLNGPNPEVDIDFELVFSCENGRIKTSLRNYTSGTNWVGQSQEFLRDKIAELVGKAISTKAGPVAGEASTGLLSEFLSFGINFDIQNPNITYSCRIIRVDRSGNIHLQ